LVFLPRPEDRTAKLVLPATPVAPLGRTREESFVLRQVSLAAGAAATVCVAMHGAPVFSDVFVRLIFPASILLLSLTSEPMSAEVMSSLSFIAAGSAVAHWIQPGSPGSSSRRRKHFLHEWHCCWR
jgi:hypothetical protein